MNHPSTRTPVILVCGIDDVATATATLTLQWDAPAAVVVRHRIDRERELLIRTISDVSGVLERVEIDLAHSCVNCAIREDVVPTLERVASDGRWRSVIAHLPLTADAAQICRVAAWERRSMPHVRISSVLAAMDGASASADLLGPGLLADRDLHTHEGDGRGVAETACGIVEYADHVVLTGRVEPLAPDLVRALSRPGSAILTDPTALDAAALLGARAPFAAVEAWVDEVRRAPVPPLESPLLWLVDLRSDRAFHPGRLREVVGDIGGGAHRSRGCFWLPTRPLDVGVWTGAGGQLSVGLDGHWGPAGPLTRITVIGADDHRDDVVAAFEHALLTDQEAHGSARWRVGADGLEDWLGEIRRTA